MRKLSSQEKHAIENMFVERLWEMLDPETKDLERVNQLSNLVLELKEVAKLDTAMLGAKLYAFGIVLLEEAHGHQVALSEMFRVLEAHGHERVKELVKLARTNASAGEHPVVSMEDVNGTDT